MPDRRGLRTPDIAPGVVDDVSGHLDRFASTGTFVAWPDADVFA